MIRQLSFDLPTRTALGRDDFFVSPANASAVGLIEQWPTWPSSKLALCGDAGSGKTHLTHVWAALSGATIIPANTLSKADIPALASCSVAVEDCADIEGNATAEEALFHLHNLVLSEGHSLLLTATQPPNYWKLSLPDLASRVQATPVAKLEPPDDALLSALIMKLFNDRQISPSPATISYLTRRIDRSFSTAQRIVDALDQFALETRRPINRALAAQVLDKSGN